MGWRIETVNGGVWSIRAVHSATGEVQIFGGSIESKRVADALRDQWSGNWEPDGRWWDAPMGRKGLGEWVNGYPAPGTIEIYDADENGPTIFEDWDSAFDSLEPGREYLWSTPHDAEYRGLIVASKDWACFMMTKKAYLEACLERGVPADWYSYRSAKISYGYWGETYD